MWSAYILNIIFNSKLFRHTYLMHFVPEAVKKLFERFIYNLNINISQDFVRVCFQGFICQNKEFFTKKFNKI